MASQPICAFFSLKLDRQGGHFMNEDARRDLVPALILFILSIVFGGGGLLALVNILSVLPLIFYGLYTLKIVKPRFAYVSKKKRKKKRYHDIPFYESMREYPHPVLMPRFLYSIVGALFSVVGVLFFLIPPISKYFSNWGDIYGGMGSKKLIPIPDLPNQKVMDAYEEDESSYATGHRGPGFGAGDSGSSHSNPGHIHQSHTERNQNAKGSGPQIDEEQLAELAKAVSSFVQESSKNVSEIFKEFMATQNGQAKPADSRTMKGFPFNRKPPKFDQAAASSKSTQSKSTQPDPDAIRAQVEARVIEQIAKNDQELREISKVSVHALDVMFGGSKLTKDKYQASIEEAVELSGKTLQAAKEYIQVGHNPEVLQKFLDRSNMINQKTGELLDALVTHQQNAVEDDVDDLTQSLEELQDNLKYYKYK